MPVNGTILHIEYVGPQRDPVFMVSGHDVSINVDTQKNNRRNAPCESGMCGQQSNL